MQQRTLSNLKNSHTTNLSYLHIYRLQAYLKYSERRQPDANSSKRSLSFFEKRLTVEQKRAIFFFSLIFSANIAIGNVSLSYVSVNFNQVMRSLVPAVTMIVGILQGKSFSAQRQLSVCVVVFGVACSCYGDMTYTAVGFIYTVLCVLLAAAKVVASGEMLTGDLKLPPLELLAYMAPLALVQCLVMSFLTGEASEISARWSVDLSPAVSWDPGLVVAASGVASFTLNVSSLVANKMTSPLTLCIAANVKQVLMIAFATVIFGTPIGALNAVGILVVLTASSAYSYGCIVEEEASKAAKALVSNKAASSKQQRAAGRRSGGG